MAREVTVDHSFVIRHGIAWTRLAAEGSAYMAYALADTPSGRFFAAQSEALSQAADEASVLSGPRPCSHPEDWREGVNCALCHDTGFLPDESADDHTEPVYSGLGIPAPEGSWYGRVMMKDFERRKPLCELCSEPLDAHATHGCP